MAASEAQMRLQPGLHESFAHLSLVDGEFCPAADDVLTYSEPAAGARSSQRRELSVASWSASYAPR